MRRAVADEFAESAAWYKSLDVAGRRLYFGREKLETGAIGEGLKAALEANGVTRFTDADGNVDYEACLKEFARQYDNFRRRAQVAEAREIEMRDADALTDLSDAEAEARWRDELASEESEEATRLDEATRLFMEDEEKYLAAKAGADGYKLKRGGEEAEDEKLPVVRFNVGKKQPPPKGRYGLASSSAGSANGGLNSQTLTPESADAVRKFGDSISKTGAQSPAGFLIKLQGALGAKNANPDKSQYFDITLADGRTVSVRLANHRTTAKTYVDRGNRAEIKQAIVIKMSDRKFAPNADVALVEHVYFPDRLTAEREKQISRGIADLITNGEYTGPKADQTNRSPREGLRLSRGGAGAGALEVTVVPRLEETRTAMGTLEQTEAGIMAGEEKALGTSASTRFLPAG